MLTASSFDYSMFQMAKEQVEYSMIVLGMH